MALECPNPNYALLAQQEAVVDLLRLCEGTPNIAICAIKRPTNQTWQLVLSVNGMALDQTISCTRADVRTLLGVSSRALANNTYAHCRIEVDIPFYPAPSPANAEEEAA